MSVDKPKLIVIIGPTASGKSELAVWLAKKFPGEIISADSRQVYHGLDIGTGKINGRWQRREDQRIYVYKNIPHHCIDFVSPKKTYTVAEFKERAKNAIKNITSRGKIPIIAGGTGFWIDTLVYDIHLPAVPPNWKLRRRLEKKSAKELLKILKNLDPRRAQTVEPKNPRRLIRAIEIARTIGKVPKIEKRTPYTTLWIGLKPPQAPLKQKVASRAKNMIKRGLVKETKKLLQGGISRKRVQELGFEYLNTLDYLENKISREEFAERLIRGTLSYAKRQMTWFGKNRNIRWINTPDSAFLLAENF